MVAVAGKCSGRSKVLLYFGQKEQLFLVGPDMAVFDPYFCILIANTGTGKSISFTTAVLQTHFQYRKAVVATAPNGPSLP
jgi:hypothetical protein